MNPGTAEAAPAPAEAAPPPAAEVVETPAVETFVDPVELAFAKLAEKTETEEAQGEPEAPAAAGEEAPPAPAAKPGEALAEADEALFSDAALSKPEGLKAAAARVRELKAEAIEGKQKIEQRQRKLDKFDITLKNRERKFEATKDEHLRWHAGQRDEARVLGSHVTMMRTGTPQQFLDSLGFLRGKDGRSAFEELVAAGAGMQKQPNPEIEELRREQRAFREELARERQLQQQHADTQHKQAVVEQRSQEILTAAQNVGAYPTLAQYVAIRPNEVLNELVSLKRAHKKETGLALPDDAAMLELDRQLALLIGQRGGTGNPRPEQGSNPGGQSGQSSQAKPAGRIAGIPPSASTQVPAQRETTEEERRQELTPDFYQGIGLW